MDILLRNRYVAGQVLRYRGTTVVKQLMPRADGQPDIEGPNARQHEWEAALLAEVVAVEPDGTAHLVVRAALEDVDPMGTEAALEAQRTVSYLKVDACGNMLLSSSVAPLVMYTLPKKPVRASDAWYVEQMIPMPPSGQMAPVTYDYRLLRFEEVDGRQCAVIDVHAQSEEWEVHLPEAPFLPGKGFGDGDLSDTHDSAFVSVQIDGTLIFDVEAGLLVRADVKTLTRPRIGMQVVTTETTVTQRLQPVEQPTAS